ncbi:MAG TPA: ABC transporter substrate-binding protein [Thermomicrobiales bacterium]|nr:ABC transporter substrate-binding protein [Thermomicrobiales bacterium]
MHPSTSTETPNRVPRVSRRTAIRATAGGVAAVLASGLDPRSIAAQPTPDGDGSVTLTIPLYPHGQQIMLDPHRATNWGPHWVMLPNVWEGLLRFDENGAVVPALATSVEPEDDGRVWVASIAPEAVFASGNPVTAQAMVEGWKRAIRPQRPAPMTTFMRRVEGFDAYLAGESDEIGFEARDESTVAITLAEPYALFPEELATFVWAAVDTTALADVPDSQAPFANASAGRWRFVDGDTDQGIRMEPNEHASGLPQSFGAVVWRPMDGPQAAESALDAYRAGELPVADVTHTLRDTITDDEQLQAQLQTVQLPGTTMLIGMDFGQAPFDDPQVRGAVAAAIDRERWASEIMADTFLAATSITPPVLSETAGYQAPEPLPFDPGTARQLLADAGIDDDTMPQVTYYQPAESSEWDIERAAALLAMIQENSGLVIEHDTSLTAQQIEALRNDNGGLQFELRWWWPLTNSPSGLADLGLPSSSSMQGWFNWSPDLEDTEASEAAQAFTETIQRATTSMNTDERNQLFAQAEESLIQNVVYIPLGHWVQQYLQSPTLTGTRQGAFSGYAPVTIDENVGYQPDTSTPAGGA